MSDPIEIITVDDLRAYLGADAPANDAGLQLIVEIVNALVSEKWRNPIDPVPVSVKVIALEVAARPVRNPRGLASWTRSIDDGSRTERLSEARARAGIYLTDEELADLNGLTRRPRRRFGTIRVTPGYLP